MYSLYWFFFYFLFDSFFIYIYMTFKKIEIFLVNFDFSSRFLLIWIFFSFWLFLFFDAFVRFFRSRSYCFPFFIICKVKMFSDIFFHGQLSFRCNVDVLGIIPLFIGTFEKQWQVCSFITSLPSSSSSSSSYMLSLTVDYNQPRLTISRFILF